MDQSGYAGLRKRQLDDGRETGEHTFGSNICSTRPQERSREGEAVDRTAVGSRVGFADRATRILPAVPLHRGPVRFRTLVFRYLAVAFVLLLVATVAITRPYGTVEAAARPGVQIPNAMLGVVDRVAPGAGVEGGASGVGPAQRRLLTHYWTSFVAHPLSRMQPGTPVLASAPPGKKAGVLAGLRKNVSAVNDWALGRHGPERAFIATSALGYVLPFAVVLGMLAMVAACAQTMLFVLCLVGLFAVPFAVAGRRQRGALIRYWLLPLLAAVAVPALAALLMGRRVVRRWRDGRSAPSPIPGS